MIEFDRKQDKLIIVAPASGCKDAQGRMDNAASFERLQSTVNFFKENGFQCTYDDQIFAGDTLEYFASPKAERLRQLKNALEDPAVKIISAFRGGYGCSEIVFDCLDIVPSGPKILIGFSDITVLHFLFNQHYKFPSIHGAMYVQQKKMLEEIVSILEGNDTDFDLKPLNKMAKISSNITGKMFGGNLTLLCNMIGTKLHPVTKNKILFMEDVSERGYQVHRHLMHLHNAGLFEKVRGIIFGDFTNSDEYIEPTIKTFIDEYLVNIPAYRTTGIGHGEKNYPITIGGMGKITGRNLTVRSPFKLV